MSVRVELLLACDLWRSSSCEGRASLVVEKDAVAQGEARLRRRCRDEGWAQERGEGGTVLDAYPACSYARFAAEVTGATVPPPRAAGEAPIPATIGEAAALARRLRTAPPNGPPRRAPPGA